MLVPLASSCLSISQSKPSLCVQGNNVASENGNGHAAPPSSSKKRKARRSSGASEEKCQLYRKHHERMLRVIFPSLVSFFRLLLFLFRYHRLLLDLSLFFALHRLDDRGGVQIVNHVLTVCRLHGAKWLKR